MTKAVRALEDRTHIAIVDYLKVALPPSALFWHTPNTFATANMAYHNKLKRMGRQAGVPDLLVLFDGRLIGLEVKATRGQLSNSQKAIRPRFEGAGGSYHIVRSIDDVTEALRSERVLKQ